VTTAADDQVWYFHERVIDGKRCGCTIHDEEGECIAIVPRLRTNTKAHWEAYRRAADMVLAHNATLWESELRGLLRDIAAKGIAKYERKNWVTQR
jgi:hypothetical protein